MTCIHCGQPIHIARGRGAYALNDWRHTLDNLRLCAGQTDGRPYADLTWAEPEATE
jgi:hypothetical protein